MAGKPYAHKISIETRINQFLKRKAVVETLGYNYQLSKYQYSQLEKLFKKYGSPKNIEGWLPTIASMVYYDVKNYIPRFRRLIQGGRKIQNGLMGQLLSKGKYHGVISYKMINDNKTKHFLNTYKFWMNQGYTKEQAKIKIHAVQLERALKAAELMRGTNEYSCRSLSFWIKRGLSEQEAISKVKEIQTTNGLDYYINKYGQEGIQKYQERIKRWQSSLNDRTSEEIEIMNKKKGWSIEGNMLRGMTQEEAVNHYNEQKIALKEQLKNSLPYSKISQKLFNSISEKVEGKIFYETLNYEYLIKGFRVDFFHKESGTVIEFYGDFFHRNPNKFSGEEIIFELKSSDKWKSDHERIEEIKKHKMVNDVIIVWENDYRQNPDKIVEYCIKRIKEHKL